MANQVINISDSPEGYKRKVEVIGWGCNEETPGYENIFVHTVCRHYENENGQYGALIEKQRIKSFNRTLSANLQRMVDPTDGMDLVVESYIDEETIFTDVVQDIPIEEQEEGGPTTQVVQVSSVISVGKTRYRRKDNNDIVASPIQQFVFFNQLTYNNINIRNLIAQFVMLEDQVHQSYDK